MTKFAQSTKFDSTKIRLNLLHRSDEVMHDCEVEQDYVRVQNNLYGTKLPFIRFHPKKVAILTSMVKHHQNTPKGAIYTNKKKTP